MKPRIPGVKVSTVSKIRRTRTQAYTVNWQAVSEAVMRRDGYKCTKCGKTRDQVKLEVHHIIPVSRGGITAMYNLTTLCEYHHNRQPFHNHLRNR